MAESSLPIADRVRLRHLIKSTSQHRVLIDLAQRYHWHVGAEIGVLKGKTLFAMLEALPKLRMYAVDQWRQLPLREDENAETYFDYNMEILYNDVMQRKNKFNGRCYILHGDSVEMADHVDDESLDFIFIDGDHTERGVERDLAAWAGKVKPDGYVLGHDFTWHTVRRVIDRECPGWTDYGESVWGVRRCDMPR